MCLIDCPGENVITVSSHSPMEFRGIPPPWLMLSLVQALEVHLKEWMAEVVFSISVEWALGEERYTIPPGPSR